VRAFALSDGRLLGQARNPHYRAHGRFLHGTDHFYFAVWDGQSVKFEPVTMPPRYLASSVTKIFDREGHPGPWLLLRSGQVVCTESSEVIKLPKSPNGPDEVNFGAARVSRGGNQLMVPVPAGAKTLPFPNVFDLEQRSWLENYHSEMPLDRNPPFPTWNVFRVIESFALTGDQIAVCGRKNRWRKLALGEDGKIRISPMPSIDSNPPAMFAAPQKTKHGCTLQPAQLAGGSKVFLDSRGMLHFKSSNPDLPEVSIVLAEGEVAGWTSDGFVCGPSFFFEGPITSEPIRVFERIMNFFFRP